MCGIAGFNFNSRELINQMNDAHSHRGPDYAGTFIDSYISLGHRRLSIIDLSNTANQPMHYKNFTIVFNGEIYNFIDIKNELKDKGHKFVTESDTEVILHSFEEWGKDCLNHFNGMWAFCIYDKKEQELFIARDRFGIKPLYYYFENNRFIFASELKAIYQHKIDLSLNLHALNYYFYQKYVGRGETIFNEIQKLDEANYIIFNLKDNSLAIKQYYFLEKEIQDAREFSLGFRKDRINELITDAVEKRLVANVLVGSFLSGGVDSSLVSSIIARKDNGLNTFSIGFKEQSFDELQYSKLVAKKINVKHTYEILDIDESLIFDIIEKLDEPFGDSSIIPTNLLSKIAKKEVTVSLSGDAADELFGGYETYLAWKIAKFIPNFSMNIFKYFTPAIPASDKKQSLGFKIKTFINNWDKDIEIRHLNWMSQTSIEERKHLLTNNYKVLNTEIEYSKNKGLLDIQLNDFRNYLSNDILKKVDIASMQHSLETRVPFLDYRLVPLVLSLDDKFKIRRFTTKSLLKKNAQKFIPKKIIKRKKAGFSTPLSLWFKQSNKMQNVITDQNYYRHGVLDYKYINKLLEEHLKSRNDNSRILWLVFVFNIWYSQKGDMLN